VLAFVGLLGAPFGVTMNRFLVEQGSIAYIPSALRGVGLALLQRGGALRGGGVSFAVFCGAMCVFAAFLLCVWLLADLVCANLVPKTILSGVGWGASKVISMLG